MLNLIEGYSIENQREMKAKRGEKICLTAAFLSIPDKNKGDHDHVDDEKYSQKHENHGAAENIFRAWHKMDDNGSF